MCFTLHLTERWRRMFGLSCTVLNLSLAIQGLLLIIAGIAIKVKLDSRLELLEDYDPGALPIMLMVTGGLLFLTHLLATKVSYDATYIATRSNKHHYFIVLIIFLCLLCLYIFIAEIITLVHSSKIQDALDRGFHNLMLVYISDLESKERVDTIQLEFGCCGFKSYDNWFKLAWINLNFLNTSSPAVQSFIVDGKYIKDDAPFSCCSQTSKLACVHHSVHASMTAGHPLTLNPEGCSQVIAGHFHDALIEPTALLMLSILLCQASVIFVMRLLQTSIASADEMGDPEASGAAYCFQTVGAKADNREYLKKKDETKDGGDDDDDGGGGDDDDGDDDGGGDDDGDDDDDDGDGGGGLAGAFGGFNKPGKRKASGGGGGGGGGGEDSGGKSKKSKTDDDKGEKGMSKKEKKKEAKEKKKEAKDKKKEEKDQKKSDKKEKADKKKGDKKEKADKKKEEKKKKDAEKKKKKEKEKEIKKKKKEAEKAKKKAKQQAKKDKKKKEKEAKKAKKKNKKKK